MRLPAGEEHLFSGHQLQRGEPLTFFVNGIPVQGLTGDTVLSALIADGVMAAGAFGGTLLGLNENLDIPIYPAGRPEASPLPISRTPATNGARYLTEPGRRALKRPRLPGWLDRFRPRNLKADFNVPLDIPGPWMETPDTEDLTVDTLVIGGGIAGLSAAAKLADSTDRILLLERRGYCGGDAPLFGRVEGEEAPETVIPRLIATFETAENCETRYLTEALSIDGQTVYAHQVYVSDGFPRTRLLAITANRIIIATGAAETLPVFPGNRQPAVTGLTAAYHLASAYGAWPADNALVSTSTNAGYRLALLMQDAGIKALKIADSRLSPQSRFIEFSKAYGIKFEWGLKPHAARYDERSRTIEVELESRWADEGVGESTPLPAGCLLVGGGWQPRLGLWQQAGGKVAFTGTSGKISARGSLDNVILTGSGAGLQSTAAVIRSGQAAAVAALGASRKRVVDRVIDAAFETPDDALTITAGDADLPAFLSNGPSLVTHGAGRIRGGLLSFLKPADAAMDAAERALSLGDLVALQSGGASASGDFDALVRERAVVTRTFSAGVRKNTRKTGDGGQDDQTALPAFLNGRFGKGAGRCLIDATGGGTFEPGNLIYATSDTSKPDQAIGVVLKADTENGAQALLTADMRVENRHLTVRTSGASVSAIIRENL